MIHVSPMKRDTPFQQGVFSIKTPDFTDLSCLACRSCNRRRSRAMEPSRRRKRKRTGVYHPFVSILTMSSAISNGIGLLTTSSVLVVPNFGIWSNDCQSTDCATRYPTGRDIADEGHVLTGESAAGRCLPAGRSVASVAMTAPLSVYFLTRSYTVYHPSRMTSRKAPDASTVSYRWLPAANVAGKEVPRHADRQQGQPAAC
jgi:hypothetical protein